MTRIYFVYSRKAGTQSRTAFCECDTLDATKAMDVANQARARGLVVFIKAMDVPTEELA